MYNEHSVCEREIEDLKEENKMLKELNNSLKSAYELKKDEVEKLYTRLDEIRKLTNEGIYV